ncbi:hypothetical protein AJ87_08750 [Rhizobium yanglingense]|nr:hypothetical protein AJ87_08750 [Rhizobium yanglingense]
MPPSSGKKTASFAGLHPLFDPADFDRSWLTSHCASSRSNAAFRPARLPEFRSKLLQPGAVAVWVWLETMWISNRKRLPDEMVYI